MLSILICLYYNMAAIIPTFVLLINSSTNIVVVWSISVWSNTIPLWATRKKDFYWMVISVAHLLIILLTFKNNIVWLLTISPTDDISVYESNSMYVPCMSILQPTILYSWEKNFKRRAFFLSFIKRLVEILESQKN